MFFVDRVNVTIFWEYSLWNMDGLAQLLSKKISKKIEAKNKLVLSKLLEQLNFLSVFLSF